MTHEQEALEAWERSAAGWLEEIDGANFNRVLLLDAPMLEHCGDVTGLDVLDIGCGEGRFCRMLFQRGAQVTGLDPTPNLLDAARLRDPGGHYVDGSGESLPFPADRFDLVVSYLVLIDIPDFRAAIREMARVLRPGGRAVVASLLPYATCGAWVLDEDQRLLYRTIDHYFGERPERYSWGNIEVVNWHRPLEAYFQAFLASGLNLRDYREPCPSPEAVAMHPSMACETRVPLFNTMVWAK